MFKFCITNLNLKNTTFPKTGITYKHFFSTKKQDSSSKTRYAAVHHSESAKSNDIFSALFLRVIKHHLSYRYTEGTFKSFTYPIKTYAPAASLCERCFTAEIV